MKILRVKSGYYIVLVTSESVIHGVLLEIWRTNHGIQPSLDQFTMVKISHERPKMNENY